MFKPYITEEQLIKNFPASIIEKMKEKMLVYDDMSEQLGYDYVKYCQELFN